MSEDKLTVRSVYGRPLSKMAGTKLDPPYLLLKKAGTLILESVRKEIKTDAAKHNAMNRAVGQPVSIPNSKEFVLSFKVSVKGKKIEISSDWPFVEHHLEGRDPYPMTWLTQAEGIKKVPMITSAGVVLVRMAPLTKEDAWIHPGFLKYNFLERGVRKGREAAAEMLAKEMLPSVLSTLDLLR